jgi:hypothetical protein
MYSDLMWGDMAPVSESAARMFAGILVCLATAAIGAYFLVESLRLIGIGYFESGGVLQLLGIILLLAGLITACVLTITFRAESASKALLVA